MPSGRIPGFGVALGLQCKYTYLYTLMQEKFFNFLIFLKFFLVCGDVGYPKLDTPFIGLGGAPPTGSASVRQLNTLKFISMNKKRLQLLAEAGYKGTGGTLVDSFSVTELLEEGLGLSVMEKKEKEGIFLIVDGYGAYAVAKSLQRGLTPEILKGCNLLILEGDEGLYGVLVNPEDKGRAPLFTL